MIPFGITQPGRILFGRGQAAQFWPLVALYGARVLVVHGSLYDRHPGLRAGREGLEVLALACRAEPDLPMLEETLAQARAFGPHVVVGIGGGSVLDLAKALAALIPAPGEPMDHLEVVGRGLPLVAPPLPFLAVPTTAGTGAEVTKNAVLGVPSHRRKVSLRDDRMLARVALVDPALTDGCPRGVTLASGLDAVTQVIEPFVSGKATPYTDALTRPAIPQGLAALRRLMQGEDEAARDALAWVSLTGGLALANGGLGAVHGLAGVIGGVTGAAHGAICGALLGPVLAMNAARAAEGSQAAARLTEVLGMIGQAFGVPAGDAAQALAQWAREAGLPPLELEAADRQAVAEASLASSSMKGNPVTLTVADLAQVLDAAAR